MPDYRVFLLGPDGHVFRSILLRDIPDDAAAALAAAKLVDGHDVELWQLDRKIAAFERKAK